MILLLLFLGRCTVSLLAKYQGPFRVSGGSAEVDEGLPSSTSGSPSRSGSPANRLPGFALWTSERATNSLRRRNGRRTRRTSASLASSGPAWQSARWQTTSRESRAPSPGRGSVGRRSRTQGPARPTRHPGRTGGRAAVPRRDAADHHGHLRPLRDARLAEPAPRSTRRLDGPSKRRRRTRVWGPSTSDAHATIEEHLRALRGG